MILKVRQRQIQSIIGIMLLFCSLSYAENTGPFKSRIKVPEPLSRRLSVVLSEANSLHKALYEKKGDKQVRKRVSVVIAAINKSLELSFLAKERRLHLEKILRAASQQLASTNDPTASKKEAFQETYRQLIQIAKGYEVKHNFKYFYCPKDKSTWFQSESKPQNPINPDGPTGKCGTLMK